MAKKSKKAILIKSIKKIIDEWGSFDVSEVQADCSPCVQSLGKLTALAERFGKNVDVVVYDKDGNEHDEYTVEYEELSVDVLEEIERLAQDYEADQIRTEKRCSN